LAQCSIHGSIRKLKGSKPKKKKEEEKEKETLVIAFDG
jgi:hypothetical protein